MAITYSHVAFSRAFDAAPLAWKNPVAKMEAHPYGVILFDEAGDKKQYSYKNLFAHLYELEKPERRHSCSINCVYINPIIEMCWIYDYREITPDATIAEKIDFTRSMLVDLAAEPTAPFTTVVVPLPS